MLKQMINGSLGKVGYSIVKNPQRWNRQPNKNQNIPYDMQNDEFAEIYNLCNPFTMTSMERQFSLYNIVRYISENNIKGDIVECGVWRGGSSMICAKTLLNIGDTTRTINLYDTYEGMTPPTEKDTRAGGSIEFTQKMWEASKTDCGKSTWCAASIKEVMDNMRKTEYPMEKMKFIKGDVCKTINKRGDNLPEKIALLRLDTDFYDSSKHELEYLYPLLVKGGVLILDDYGTWDGQKQATDEYFEENNLKPLMLRIDAPCRVIIKT